MGTSWSYGSWIYDYLRNQCLSLLNTVYKIGSGVIASRLKRVLEKMIDLDQTGFISGRYIGDNIRLIYDMLQFTEENNIPGLLLLIDFEKHLILYLGTFFYLY